MAVTHFDDEFYRDILEGLAVVDGRPLLRDLVATIARVDEPRLGAALNANQMASKRWLIDALAQSAGTRFDSVLVLGGWVGALPALLLHDPRLAIGRVVSVDIDARCEAVARSLNATHAAAGRFQARTADMRELDYEAERFALVVNTSCEHVVDLDRWYARVPTGQLVVLQSNDYVACTEHVNCVGSLDEFKDRMPMRELLFAGARPMRRYTRFMLIGRR